MWSPSSRTVATVPCSMPLKSYVPTGRQRETTGTKPPGQGRRLALGLDPEPAIVEPLKVDLEPVPQLTHLTEPR